MDKFSLWIVPRGKTGDTLQDFVNTLAGEYKAPRFVPHLTLAANILTRSEAARHDVQRQAVELARAVTPFDIQFSGFGHTEEEFRCLFLKTKPSDELDATYETATRFFPQIADEYFRGMPHMSVLYGLHDTNRKEQTINQHETNAALANAVFRVESFDLYLTNSPIESWSLDTRFDLSS